MSEASGGVGRGTRHRRRWIVTGVVLAHLLGIASSLDALMSSRTAPGAVAWIVSLSTFPYVAVPAYWVFGRARFQGYVVGRRDVDNRLHHALEAKMAGVHAHSEAPPATRHLLPALERLAKLPLLGGNRVELLIDGDATFASLFAGMAAAQRHLLVQFYIVRDDTIGRELKRVMEERARAGVAVHFLYDEIGSYRLPRRYLDELVAAGVQVRPFHSTRGTGNRLQLNFRNHRKIVVADGHSGWAGGFNVGEEYLGRDPRIGPWRDTHLKLEGPAVFALQLAFIEDWHWASGEILDLDWRPAPAHDNGVPVLVLPSGPADRFETASLMVQHALASAQRRVWIASPYFVPDEGVQAALKLAALRGVDVRVLIPQQPDNPLLYFAAYAFLGPLLDAGVRVFRYHDGFLHCKTILVDDDAAAVGTVNLDNRSFRLNFEVTVWVADRDFASRMAAKYAHDFAGAHEMRPQDLSGKRWWLRVASRAAYLLAPVL
ncbi:MAG: cardiolipin synthase [Rubrivivax sp.]|nr:cardiolipin synthase [Rubrivivax sp.]